MALRKTLASRLFSISKIRAASAVPATCPCSSARRLPSEEPPLLLRLLQRRPFFQAAVPPDRIAALPAGEKLIERIRGLGGGRIRLDGILPPVLSAPPEAAAEGMPVSEVKKVLRAAQIEAARAKLRAVPASCVSYSEYLQICCEVSSADQGPGIARLLDESGAVIVLGDVVLLRPDQVAKVIQSLITPPTAAVPQCDGRNSELREMEEKKAVIDKKATDLVRTELWGGLGFLALQTVGFMRLTFWELSWDTMEPICFFATSLYFMLGYTFFMRTSKEPSFEGFFQARFATKQKRLMKAHNFDPLRFSELKRACPPHSSEELTFHPSYCHCNRGKLPVGTDWQSLVPCDSWDAFLRKSCCKTNNEGLDS